MNTDKQSKANQVAILRKAAQAADDRLSRELVRVFGDASADARYRCATKTHGDVALASATRAKIAADAAVWAAIDVWGDPK